MTDFYSVLKSSIIQRNLRSEAARHKVYEQAREAMIRRLWSFDPPLSEDEIDARIGLFDAAVERIEADLARSSTAENVDWQGAEPRPRQAPRAEQPRPPPYDDDWQVAEGYVAESRPQLDAMEPAHRQTSRQRQIHGYDARRELAYEEDIARAGFDRGDLHHSPAAVDVSARDAAYGDADEYRGHDYRETEYPEESYRRPRYEEAAYYESDDEKPYRAAPTRRDPDAYSARGAADGPSANDAYTDELEPARYRSGERRPGKRPQARGGKRSRRAGTRSVPILAIIVGALAVILIAFNVYIFLPILMGSDPSPSTAATSPAKIEDRLPAAEPPGPASAQVVSNSATAVEIPERSLDVTESLVIFDGSDPTVFEGTSNNPIQFDSDTEGGFARISSAASAAGARAIIGPGLAERLAGQTVRVTLLARSSDENGATQMRFAYQSGLAVSHWQSADLSSNYGTYGMIWRVPAADTGEHDYLLIEPGIPGDGTSTDIRMIKIDILAS